MTTPAVGAVQTGSPGSGSRRAEHPIGRPLHRGDRGDAESLVDGGAARVVDAGDDPFDPERLTGDAGGEDVRVVAARHGGHRVGVFDAGRLQPFAVEPDAGHGGAAEIGGQATERLGLAVDDGDRVALRSELCREAGSDPSASDDDHVHSALTSRARMARSATLRRSFEPESTRPSIEIRHSVRILLSLLTRHVERQVRVTCTDLGVVHYELVDTQTTSGARP